MDSKIKISTIWVYTICALMVSWSLTGCKKNNWLDWKVQNELWLENNKKQPGVEVSSTGLQYKIIADPTANNGDAKPNKTSTITCDYTVRLINGYQVDGGNGVQLSLSAMIPGFTEGCTKIHNHGDIELYVPAYLGYDYSNYESNDYGDAEGSGTEGTQSYIPPYSTLIFTIHISSVSGS